MVGRSKCYFEETFNGEKGRIEHAPIDILHSHARVFHAPGVHAAEGGVDLLRCRVLAAKVSPSWVVPLLLRSMWNEKGSEKDNDEGQEVEKMSQAAGGVGS